MGLDILAGDTPIVMGIINVTPDSFSDGGETVTVDAVYRRIEAMVLAGADIIDLGAESSRPGADSVSLDEEKRRLDAVLSGLSSRFDVVFSLDTMKAEVAEMGLAAGVTIINDISAFTHDEAMLEVIHNYQAIAVAMHRQGVSITMQDSPTYTDVVAEVCSYLNDVKDRFGPDTYRLILDPGIGFGKSVEHNLCLLKHLSDIVDLGCPVLLGTSRKSFIGQVTGADVGSRVSGSLASIVLALSSGVRLFRVHDVAESRQALDLAYSILKQK